jgi:hypothetical protein
VRSDFAFHDELRWARAYGLLESVRKRKAGDELSDEDGTFTGNRRYRDQAHEIPGVSPAIITRLLHNSIFLNLKDLGIELPPYTEEVVELDMEDEHTPVPWDGKHPAPHGAPRPALPVPVAAVGALPAQLGLPG